MFLSHEVNAKRWVYILSLNECQLLHVPFSSSLGDIESFLAIGYVFISSARERALKYRFEGCSCLFCSMAYCSIGFKLYCFCPRSSSFRSKNWSALFPISIMYDGGNLSKSDIVSGHIHIFPPPRFSDQTSYPSISTILDTWLYSELPGNKGKPKKSSAAMHPRDHMSMALV